MRGKLFLLYTRILFTGELSVRSFYARHVIKAALSAACMFIGFTGFSQAPVTGLKANGRIMNAGDTVNICIGSSIFYENLAQNGTVNWQFKSGTPLSAVGIGPYTIVYTKAGTDSTIQTVISGLDTVQMFIIVKVNNQKPTAAFSVSQPDSCGNVPVLFNSSASVPNTGPLTYKWFFGDGGSNTNANPSYQFLSAIGVSGTVSYNVKLVVTNGLNCSDSVTKIVAVKKIPDASLNNPDGLVGYYPYNGVQTFARCTNSPSYLFSFRNASTTTSINTKYKIEWGDGSPDSIFTSMPASAIFMHPYTIGQHTLTMTVEGSTGCIGIKKYNIFLGTTPAGGFATPGNNDICAPGGLNFIISGYANNTIGTTYSIFVNDGTEAIVYNHPPPDTVSHFFSNTSCGTYTGTYANSFNATLVIANPCLTTSVDVKPIFVSTKPKPALGIYPSNFVCTNATVSFSNISSGGNTVTSAGNVTQCSNTGKQVWTITPSTGYILSFGDLGSTNGNATNTSVWKNGSSFINIVFTTAGTYTIKMQTGTDRCGVEEIVRTVCVRNPPQASFTMNKKFGCGIDTAFITNTSPSGSCLGDTYNWTVSYIDPLNCNTFVSSIDHKFVNGTLASSKNPNIQFLKTGRYIITLTVSAINTSFTCPSAVYRDTFFVKAPPKANINPVSTVCIGNPISPTASVSNCYGTDPLKYQWILANGSPDTVTTLIPGAIAYASIGSYPVYFNVTNECGVTRDTAMANIISRPFASAGADVSVCSGTSASLGAPAVTGLTYQWSPATGLSSTTSASPTLNRIYAGPSADTTFTYVITTSAGVNCSSTDTVLVTVRKNPVVTVAPAASQTCLGTPKQLVAQGAERYAWTPAVISGNSVSDTVMVNPSATTNYTVTGTAANGCTATANAAVTVIPYINVLAGRDTLVCNSTANVQLSGSPAGGTWSGHPNLSANGIFNATASGNGLFQAIYTAGNNGCNTSDTLTITVTDIPVANAGADTIICQQAGTLLLQGKPTGGRWSGSSLVTTGGIFNTNTPGTYNLVYTIGAGTCIGRDTIQVTVSGSISNNTIQGSQTICTGLQPLALSGSSATGGNGGIAYQWQQSLDGINFTDVANAVQANFQPGILSDTTWYRRVATTMVCNGPQANLGNLVKVTVNPDAIAAFNPTATIGCVPFVLTPSVINLQPYNDRVSEYRWYVNNAAIGTSPTFPGYTIPNPGDSITLRLVAISRFGCKNDTLQRGFKTIERPVPSFTKDTSAGCGPLVVNFTNTTPNANQYVFEWNFGQGQNSSLVQPGPVNFPVHPQGGDTTYTITMTVFSACDTIPVITTVTVRGKPRVLFLPDRNNGCSPMPVTFTNTSKGTSANYTWNFGDGSPLLASNNSTVNHTYTVGSRTTFFVKLQGSNDCGIDSTIFNLVVNPNSIRSNFSVNGNQRFGCAPHTVQFINNTTGANTFTWNFGDGSPTIVTTKSIDTLTHVYTKSGTFTTTLLSSNSCNDTTDAELVTIALKPLVNFTASTLIACVTDTIRFNNQSDTAIANAWRFGDNTTSAERNPYKIYAKPGLYRVQLTGSRVFAQGFGCSDSSYVDVQVRDTLPGRIIASQANGLCLPFTVTFKNADGFSGDTRWNFGDGIIATGDSVSHTYTNQGNFLVTMIGKATGGCTYKAVQNVSITSPQGQLSYNGGFVCPGTSLRFDIKNGTAATYQYFFGDGDSVVTSAATVFHLYKKPGSFVPYVYLVSGSCKIKIATGDTVKAEAIKAGFSTRQNQQCGSTQVNFSDTSSAFFGIQSWQWNFGDGTTSTLQNPAKTFTADGTYFTRLAITAKSGCADTVTVPVNIDVHAYPDATIAGDSIACTGQPLAMQALTVSKDAVANYSWTFGNNTQSSGRNASALYNTPGSYTARLLVNTVYGCADTVYKTISVRSAPLVNAGPDVRICKGQAIQLNAAGASAWQWAPMQNLSCGNCSSTLANPGVSTQYVVAGTNAAGCTSRDTINVEVIQPFTLSVSPTDSICIGQGTLIMANGANNYLWSPATRA